MNKVFLGLILAVCVLGMALVMLNDRLGRKTETAQPAPPVHSKPMPRSPEEMAAAARAIELAQARAALEGQESRLPDSEPVSEIPENASSKDTASHAGNALPEVRPQRLPEPALKPDAPRPKPAPREAQPDLPRPKPETGAEPKPAKPEQLKQDIIKAEAAPKAETKPDAGKPAASGGKAATRFVVYARDKGATVRIGGNAKVEYSSLTLENPNRVVVDLAGDWKFPPNPGIPKNDLVSAVRVGQNGDKTRVVIDLKIKPRKVILVPFKNGDGVDVRVDK